MDAAGSARSGAGSACAVLCSKRWRDSSEGEVSSSQRGGSRLRGSCPSSSSCPRSDFAPFRRRCARLPRCSFRRSSCPRLGRLRVAAWPWPALLLFELVRGTLVAVAAAVPLWSATMAGGIVDALRGAQEQADASDRRGSPFSARRALFFAGGDDFSVDRWAGSRGGYPDGAAA